MGCRLLVCWVFQYLIFGGCFCGVPGHYNFLICMHLHVLKICKKTSRNYHLASSAEKGWQSDAMTTLERGLMFGLVVMKKSVHQRGTFPVLGNRINPVCRSLASIVNSINVDTCMLTIQRVTTTRMYSPNVFTYKKGLLIRNIN